MTVNDPLYWNYFLLHVIVALFLHDALKSMLIALGDKEDE